MGAVSFANIKYCGSHCGVSIGEDGKRHFKENWIADKI
jgi:transketolase